MELNEADFIETPDYKALALPTTPDVNSTSLSDMLDSTLQTFVTLADNHRAQVHELKKKTCTLLDEMLHLKEEIEAALEDETPLEEMEET